MTDIQAELERVARAVVDKFQLEIMDNPYSVIECGDADILANLIAKALAAQCEEDSQRIEQLEEQIDVLAQFIIHDCPGEPSQSEGAVDTAVRIIRQLQDEVARLNGRTTDVCVDLLEKLREPS